METRIIVFKRNQKQRYRQMVDQVGEAVLRVVVVLLVASLAAQALGMWESNLTYSIAKEAGIAQAVDPMVFNDNSPVVVHIQVGDDRTPIKLSKNEAPAVSGPFALVVKSGGVLYFYNMSDLYVQVSVEQAHGYVSYLRSMPKRMGPGVHILGALQ